MYLVSVSAFLVVLTLNTQDAFAEEPSTWISREGPNNFFYFNVSRTVEFCRKNVIPIEFDDRVMDYSDIINKAVALMNTKGGGTVYLSAGTFIVAGSIEVLSHTCIYGKGRDLTTIKLRDKAPGFTEAGILRTEGAEHIDLQSFRIDGSRTNQDQNEKRAGIHFSLVNFVRIQDMLIIQNSGDGVYIRGGRKGFLSSYMVFSQIHAWDNAGNGFYLYRAAWAYIGEGSAGRNGRHGITIASSKHLELARMLIPDNKGENSCGLEVFDGTRNVLAERLRISNATQAGICARNSEMIEVRYGYISNDPERERNAAVCYFVRETNGFQAENNTCLTNGGQLSNIDLESIAQFPKIENSVVISTIYLGNGTISPTDAIIIDSASTT